LTNSYVSVSSLGGSSVQDDVYVANYFYSTSIPVQSINSAKRCYISSNLFQDKLLSLTDADFAYKVDLYGIATATGAIGSYPKLTIQ
jgi:hypothetical protein